MAIPIGTKFHGVAPDVETKNLGSQQANSQRDVYTFPDDFKSLSYLSYAGTMINMGSLSQASPLGGDTADFGTSKSTMADHIGFVIVPVAAKVISAGWQWASQLGISQAAGQGQDKTLTFKISTCPLGVNANDANNWTDYTMSSTVLIAGGQPEYPGFLEDTSGLNITVPANHIVTITAITDIQFQNTGEEANVSITLQPV